MITPVEHEGAKMGLFITLAPFTAPVRSRAAAAGFYETLAGKRPECLGSILCVQAGEVERGRTRKGRCFSALGGAYGSAPGVGKGVAPFGWTLWGG